MSSLRIRGLAFCLVLMCLVCCIASSAMASECRWMADLNNGKYLYDLGEDSFHRDDLHEEQGISTYNATKLISDTNGEVVLDGKYDYFYGVILPGIPDSCTATITFLRDEVPAASYTLNAKTKPTEVIIDVKGCDFFEIVVECEHPYHYESLYIADACFVKGDANNLSDRVSPEYEDYSWINQPDDAVWIDTLNPTHAGHVVYLDWAEDKRSNSYQTVYKIDESGDYLPFWETSIMELLLDGEYQSMVGKVFCDPERDSEGYLLIYGDGKLLYNSGDMTYKTKMKTFNIDVTGVEELHIFGYGSAMYLAESYFMPAE